MVLGLEPCKQWTRMLQHQQQLPEVLLAPCMQQKKIREQETTNKFELKNKPTLDSRKNVCFWLSAQCMSDKHMSNTNGWTTITTKKKDRFARLLNRRQHYVGNASAGNESVLTWFAFVFHLFANSTTQKNDDEEKKSVKKQTFWKIKAKWQSFFFFRDPFSNPVSGGNHTMEHRCHLDDLKIINETNFRHVFQKQDVQQHVTQTFESWTRSRNLIVKETQLRETVLVSTAHGCVYTYILFTSRLGTNRLWL